MRKPTPWLTPDHLPFDLLTPAAQGHYMTRVIPSENRAVVSFRYYRDGVFQEPVVIADKRFPTEEGLSNFCIRSKMIGCFDWAEAYEPEAREAYRRIEERRAIRRRIGNRYYEVRVTVADHFCDRYASSHPHLINVQLVRVRPNHWNEPPLATRQFGCCQLDAAFACQEQMNRDAETYVMEDKL